MAYWDSLFHAGVRDVTQAPHTSSVNKEVLILCYRNPEGGRGGVGWGGGGSQKIPGNTGIKIFPVAPN
jgi:hypothetical protein